jgi:thiol:disulfide interchange protein
MRIARLALTLLLLSTAALAHALDVQPYTPQALEAAQKAQAPVALHFRADWCPTCRAQDKILHALEMESGLQLTVLSVSYDNETALKSRFKVQTQSTLIVLRGTRETARLVGNAASGDIRAALKSAL